MNQQAGIPEVDKTGERVRSMFCDIAPRYDFLNHLLSANQDVRWRKRAVRVLRPRAGQHILDLCCGTGDLSFEVLRQQPACRVVAADFAFAMLKLAQEKDKEQQLQIANADALRLPFVSEGFDAALCAFGVRNFENTEHGLREMYRVLKPGGKLLILEFMRPRSALLQKAFGAFNIVLAPIGRKVSGHPTAYCYLPQSIGGFYTREEFAGVLRNIGFRNIRRFEHTGGVATTILASKDKP